MEARDVEVPDDRSGPWASSFVNRDGPNDDRCMRGQEERSTEAGNTPNHHSREVSKTGKGTTFSRADQTPQTTRASAPEAPDFGWAQRFRCCEAAPSLRILCAEVGFHERKSHRILTFRCERKTG